MNNAIALFFGILSLLSAAMVVVFLFIAFRIGNGELASWGFVSVFWTIAWAFSCSLALKAHRKEIENDARA